MQAIKWSYPSKLVKMLLELSTSTTAFNRRLSSSLTVSTWNCTTLNSPDRIAALHSPSTPIGKTDSVLIQEMRLVNPAQLPTQNPLSRLHHPFATRGHRAILGKDCGIIFRNTKWQVEEHKIGDYFTYAKIRIPDDEPAIGTNIRLLHVWSINAPPA